MTDTPKWPLTLFYDGDCPLCLREIRLFKRLNTASRLHLVDIANIENAVPPGMSREHMLGRLHACFADGELVTGIDATYWSYKAAGLGWVVKPLGWRWCRPFWERAYELFCRFRPRLAKLLPGPKPSCDDAAVCRPAERDAGAGR